MRRINLALIGIVFVVFFISSAIAQQPKYGGTLVVSARSDITSFNPVWKFDSSAYYMSLNMYSTLVVWDYGRVPYGDLAKSWDVSSDGLTYTFHLHDNVYWHDGVKFSSDDVKFTYETDINKKYPLAKYLELVKEILTPDKNTVVFKLTEPNVAFIPMLSQVSNWYGQIIAKHLYEGTDISTNPNNKKPVGTGPFKFEEYQDGQYLSVVANEKYFRGRPYLDKIIWRLYSNNQVANADFRSGNLDLMISTMRPSMHEVKTLANLPGVKLWKQTSVYGLDVLFNHARKPLSNIRVREAVSLAVDRKESSDLVWAGLVEPNYYASCVGERKWTNTNVRWPQKNLQRARELLDEAGYPAGPDGIRMNITIIVSSQDYFSKLAEVMIQQLKGVGIQAKIDLMDSATWFSRLRSGDFDLCPYWVRFAPDPDAYREHFGTEEPRNYGKYSNGTLDQLLKEGLKTFDFAKRKEVYGKVQEILRKDFVYLPVTEFVYFELSKTNMHGNPNGDPSSYGKSFGWYGYNAAWLDK